MPSIDNLSQLPCSVVEHVLEHWCNVWVEHRVVFPLTGCHLHSHADVVCTLQTLRVRSRGWVYVTRRCMYVFVDDLRTLCVALFGDCIGYIFMIIIIN